MARLNTIFINDNYHYQQTVITKKELIRNYYRYGQQVIAYRKRSGSSIPIQKSLPKSLAAGDNKLTDVSPRPK